jgi:UDP-N-acetylmuramate dehydrogenase
VKNSHYKTIDFSKFSSIRVGPAAEVYMIDSYDYPDDAFLIGAANNLLVGPQHPPLMKLSKTFDFIRIEEGKLRIGAATPGGKIVSFCKKHDIGGLEFLSHLPGTLGGMLQMNAGMKEYEIFNPLIRIRMRDGWVDKSRIDYGYRHTGISEVVFEAEFAIERGFSEEKLALFKKMRANQPGDPSAGSFFKNPPGDYAGRLIESVGLKGHRIGDMAFSERHANFLVNLGEGTFEEAMALAELAERKVFEASGIRLEREVVVVDRRYL